jgi:carboxypeptidase PM20D1
MPLPVIPAVAAFALALVALVLVLVINATRLRPTQVTSPLPVTDGLASDDCVARFQEMLRMPTVWGAGAPGVDRRPFDGFIPRLRQLYPTVFSALELTVVNGYGIMLRWAADAGSPTASAAPVVLMAHHDVVEASPNGWTHDPFAAEIAEGRIYARGAVDTKCILAALFEAVSILLAEGWKPPRDLYLCSSNCEEDMGDTALEMIKLLVSEGRTPYLVLDEGGAVIDNAPLGVACDFAAIGVAEKGIVNVAVTTRAKGGHAATPSPGDSTSKLVTGLASLVSAPPATRLSAPVEAMLKELAAHGSFALRLAFANLWLFRPLVLKVMANNSETAAMVRTTYAVTELAGSRAPNVLPLEARANVNIRIDPHEDVETAVGRLRRHFDDETELVLGTAIEPSPVSPFDNEAFEYLRRVTHSVYPTAGIAPYVQSSASDAHHFARYCPNTYRFAGFLFRGDQRARIHGQDENLDVESFRRGVVFYTELIRNIGQLNGG